MNASKQKVVQYLGEAQASEQGPGAGPAVADRHDAARQPTGRRWSSTSRQTRDHAARVGQRLEDLGQGGSTR